MYKFNNIFIHKTKLQVTVLEFFFFYTNFYRLCILNEYIIRKE